MPRKKKAVEFLRKNPADERTENNLRIFGRLKLEPAASVRDIASVTGLSGDKVAAYISKCLKKELLKFTARKKGSIELNDGHPKVAGVGFCGDECLVSLMDLAGKVEVVERIAVRASRIKGRKKEILGILAAIRETSRIKDKKPCLVGIAVPETMETRGGELSRVLASGLARIFNCDAMVATHAASAAYGERELGGKTNGADVLYMHSDAGVGVFIKDEMIFEAESGCKENGREYLRPWVQFGMSNMAKELVKKGAGTDIVRITGGDIDSIGPEVVLKAAEEQDELAMGLVKRSALALGMRAAYLANMFDAGAVILSGGIERKEGNFAKFVRESAGKFLLKKVAAKAEIVLGVLGEGASSIGAALLCRRKLFMEVV